MGVGRNSDTRKSNNSAMRKSGKSGISVYSKKSRKSTLSRSSYIERNKYGGLRAPSNSHYLSQQEIELIDALPDYTD